MTSLLLFVVELSLNLSVELYLWNCHIIEIVSGNVIDSEIVIISVIYCHKQFFFLQLLKLGVQIVKNEITIVYSCVWRTISEFLFLLNDLS